MKIKKINVVEKYHSIAMQRFYLPLVEGLQEIAEEVEISENFNPDADLNYHLPWHFIMDGDEYKQTKNAVIYTHAQDKFKESVGEACYRADVVFAMSHKGKQELLDIGVPHDKIWVSYCGTDHVQGRRRNVGIIATTQPDGRKRTHILLDLVWQIDPVLPPYSISLLWGMGGRTWRRS